MPEKLPVLALSLALAAVAQTRPNLSGVWEEASHRVLARIEHNGDVVRMTTRMPRGVEVEQQTMNYVIGQDSKNEFNGAPAVSRANWDGETLAVQSVASIMGKELRMLHRFSLSADGTTLTFSERSQFGSEPPREESRTLRRMPPETWTPDTPPPAAETVYKNIQIMKGVPAPRLRTTMMRLTAWLGVQCAHCHVMGAFDKDDKPAKKRAREMFRMVQAISKDHFNGAGAVTCWTCHRGAPKPEMLPAQ